MPNPSSPISLPPNKQPKETVLSTMRAARDHDLQWQKGRVFSLVYDPGDEVRDLAKEAYTLFFSENGLNPSAFPSLKKFEAEVVGMTAGLLGDASAAGNMTSGGTESLIMAVYAAREWARAHHPEIQYPEMVLPSTAHPAFDKAACYLGVRAVHVPVGSDFRADPAAMEAAITPNTILLAGSAPAYPHGVIDPVPELAAIAARHGLLFHVDACVGGLVLPFARKLGYPMPDFDLSVPGVTSISADLHKYGYAAKGASVILYKTRELRRHMFFAITEWPGGVYASATLSGTRPGGAIAAAWAVMNFLGEEGYLALTRQVMETAEKIRSGVRRIPGLVILGNPPASVMAIGAETLDIYEIADEMTARGWHLDRQHLPACLHLTVQPGHTQVADAFLADLASAVEHVRHAGLVNRANRWLVTAANVLARRLPERWLSHLTTRASALLGGGDGLPKRSSAMYGLIGTLPNRGDLKELVYDLLDSMTRTNPNGGKS